MTTSNVNFYTDRSAAELDDKCGMAFWWNRKEGGMGIVPTKEAVALAIGRETHADLATLANQEDLSPETLQGQIDQILAPLSAADLANQAKMEVLYRRLGWLAAWGLFLEPEVRRVYENVQTEGELIFDRSPLLVGVTPDRVLRDRATGKLVYKEFKTTISASKKWLDSWMYAIQLHIGMAAISEELGEKIAYSQIIGLMKGYYSQVDHRLMHPYVWGYYNAKESKWSCSYEDGRKTGWEQMPVWEYPGGIVEWVQMCGSTVAVSQFPHSQPVFLNQRMLDGWVRRRTRRERVIHAVQREAQNNIERREVYFERRQSHCRPAFGDACPYLLACWNAEVEKNPLAVADYTVRTPHHEVEIIGGWDD